MFRVAVPWNETRVRGPVLSLAAWLSHASNHYRSAKFIAKMDDDSYLHVPDLVKILRAVDGQRRMLYLGKLAWFHWHTDIFEHEGFGWTYGMAYSAGRRCRTSNVPLARPCVGTFPFATGLLQLLSAPLAAFLFQSGTAEADAKRLAHLSVVHKRGGKEQTQATPLHPTSP